MCAGLGFRIPRSVRAVDWPNWSRMACRWPCPIPSLTYALPRASAQAVLTAPVPAGLLARSPGLLATLSGPLLAPCSDSRAWFRHPAIPSIHGILLLFPKLSLRAHHSIPIAPAFRCGFVHRIFSPTLRPTPLLLPDSVRRETGQKIYAVTHCAEKYLTCLALL